MRLCRLLRFATFVLLAMAGEVTFAQKPPLNITTGQKMTLHGKLHVGHRGFFSYVLLDTGTTYLADGGQEEGTKRVTVVEIKSDGNQALLFGHAGEEITAAGTAFVEFAAPYPYNGVLLEHATVTLANGVLVPPKPRASQSTPTVLPASLTRYMLTSTMIPNSVKSGPESIVDVATGRLLPQGNPGYCLLNAPQDFMTCACGDGFLPVRAGLVPQPFPPAQWSSVPAVTQLWKEMRAAQFDIPEGVRHPIHIQLVCERKASR